MVESATVWLVEPSVPSPAGPAEDRGTRGRLALDGETRRLTFQPEERGRALEIALGSGVKAKRVRGSPVLLVRYPGAAGAGHAIALFYFSRPPPAAGHHRLVAAPIPEIERRRSAHRMAVEGGFLKETLKEWVRAIRASTR